VLTWISTASATKSHTEAALSRLDASAIGYSGRSAAIAVVTWLIARSLGLPEAYWAVATSIVMQSAEEATVAVSMQRLAGTVLGAVAGALVAQANITRVLALAASLFMLGVLCAALHLGKPAFRFAAFAVVIITLTPRSQPASIIALHRFAEVAIGIGVGLLVQRLWPETPPVPRAM
jgi:uncharacterized membrane protein YccC